MSKQNLPLPMARALLALMPPALLVRPIEIIVRRMKLRHPALFKNMTKVQSAVVHLKPTDLPHCFVLRMGDPSPDFYLLQPNDAAEPDAVVSGSLQALVDMLEGREDGDALFFSRDIQVTGSTDVIVTLRNTLDREEINLYDEILSLCGPFAPAASIGLSLADHAARHLKEGVKRFHQNLHQEGQA